MKNDNELQELLIIEDGVHNKYVAAILECGIKRPLYNIRIGEVVSLTNNMLFYQVIMRVMVSS